MHNSPLNLYINYSIISLLKFKVIPKNESKSYNYSKILKCNNINFKLLVLSLLIYYLYKNTTHDMCHIMYDKRDKNANS